MDTKQKWLHVIGICGITTSGVAVMFKNLGWKVTGSDKGFFDPVASFVERNGLQVMPGYKAQRLTINDPEPRHPDLVLFMGVTNTNNPEYVEAKKLNIEFSAYAPLLKEYVVHPESIVVAGTYGKSTITSALVEIFSEAQIEISYMFGSISRDYKPNIKAKDSKTKYSVIEGDEYLTSLDDKRSKFFHYNPKYLILTSCQWDHPDLFPTEKDYIANFRKLVESIPSDGKIIANANDANVVEVTKSAKCEVIYYSSDQTKTHSKPEWMLVKESKPLPTFVRLENKPKDLEIIPYEKQIIGNFNEENLLAAAAMAYELGVKKERIQDAIARYQGLKRRLEIIVDREECLLIDDFGSSPPKVKGSLAALREDYPQAHITVVFEPNTGNRTPESVITYDGAFMQSDQLIFPRFTKLPNLADQVRYDEQGLAKELKEKFGYEVKIMADDDELVNYLTEQLVIKNEELKIVVFMGSHGFRGMMGAIAKNLKS